MTVPVPRFCSSCGAPLVERMVLAEQRLRLVCSGCATITYLSPQVLVSTIVTFAGRVLLCRRAEAPAVGLWNPPGGFMERNETLEEAAARETYEETGVRIEARDLRLYTVWTLPEISEVYVGFRIDLAEQPRLQPGIESLDVRFFAEAEVPWQELAYPDIAGYLRMFFWEQRRNEYSVHFSRLDTAGVVTRAYQIRRIVETRGLRLSGSLPQAVD